jgi:hypothetical protein
MPYSEQYESSGRPERNLLMLKSNNTPSYHFASNIFARKITNTLRKEKYSLILQIPRQKSFA